MQDYAESAFLIDPRNRDILQGKKKPLFEHFPFLKALKLARRGQALRGEVIFCARVRDGSGDLVVHMKYRFRAPDGRAIESVERFSGVGLPGETLPAPQTPIVVYYAADDCYSVL
ncbi:MAG: hypothetical protein HY553_19610 [Elusimicrobia bacterium]|nr:hypothetical protein [Elusimicrobiota bacterium]